MVTKKMGLGKGLGALLPDMEAEEPKSLIYCGIEEIRPNPSQPRKHFDETRLRELADSIRNKGILEPLLVRRVTEGFELIVGERRWRAAQRAGLKEVPVLIKELEGRDALEVSLIENLQREELNPLEEAETYQRLMEESGTSPEELGARLGKDRTTLVNTLRLLKLPLEVKEHLLQNRISSGHARAILSLETAERQKELCNAVIQKKLSVRETEALARRWGKKPIRAGGGEKKRGDFESQLSALEDSLRRCLGTKIQIKAKGKRGKIEIEYYSFEDLERIVEFIVKT